MLENILCNLIAAFILYLWSRSIQSIDTKKHPIIPSTILSFFLLFIFLFSLFISGNPEFENIGFDSPALLDQLHKFYSEIKDHKIKVLLSLTSVIFTTNTILNGNKNYFPIIHITIVALFCTLLFAIGGFLEMTLNAFIDGSADTFKYITTAFSVRVNFPVFFIIQVFGFCFPAGLLTAIAISNGDSLRQRMLYGMISTPLLLIIFDTIHYSFSLAKIPSFLILFSVISNLFGGIFAGYVVAGFTHFINIIPTAFCSTEQNT